MDIIVPTVYQSLVFFIVVFFYFSLYLGLWSLAGVWWGFF